MKMAFYCKHCSLDQDNFPEENQNQLVPGGWYESKCEKCSRKLIRHKNPASDPYYHESKRVIIMRDKFRRETLQYGEDGFKTFYPEQWRKFEQEREDFERKRVESKKERDRFYRENFNNKAEAKKIIDIEERMEYGN